ncbi:unnamed protein product [Trichogramma brassicae]|uniref:CCHC-type domain-containing protein n=1 Tax=Trichogramma brassicae TaxID=86971 RepID=A0A6H5IQG4_9HYME|nr:unnamed protein product [Trichogramma brassicae]
MSNGDETKVKEDPLLNESIMTEDGCDAREVETRLLARMKDYEDVVASLRDQLGIVADAMVKLQLHLTSHSVQQTQTPLASTTASSSSVSTTSSASVTSNSTITTSVSSPGDTSMAPSNYPFKFQFSPGTRPFSQTLFEAAHTSSAHTNTTGSPHSNVPISSAGFTQTPAAALYSSECFRYRPVEVPTFWHHDPASWFELLEDLDASPAEIIFGTTLRLPGEFFSDESAEESRKDFTSEFRAHMQQVKPVLTDCHQETRPFVHKDLDQCSHVFLRAPPIKKALDSPYMGPFKVLHRPSPHFMIIKMTNKKGLEERKTVSTLRVKPAFGTFDDIDLLIRENDPCDSNVEEDIECDHTYDVPEIFDDLPESSNRDSLWSFSSSRVGDEAIETTSRSSVDERRYNFQRTNEVAAVFSTTADGLQCSCVSEARAARRRVVTTDTTDLPAMYAENSPLMAAAQQTAVPAGLLDMEALCQNRDLVKTPMLSWLSGGKGKKTTSNRPTEENTVAAITKKILEAPRQGKVKDARLPSAEEFATGTYEDKLVRVEELILGLANFLQTKGNVHQPISLYTGCLERAIIALRLAGRPELPGSVTSETTLTPTASSAVSDQNRKGRKRPASSPGTNRTPKRSSGSACPTRSDAKTIVDKVQNDNNITVENDFVEVKRRRDRRRETPTQRQTTARAGQNPQMATTASCDSTETRRNSSQDYQRGRRNVRRYSAETLRGPIAPGHSRKECQVHQTQSVRSPELEAALGDTASASALRHTTSIEIKDLDECATKEGIRDALRTQLGRPDLDLDAVRSLRKAYAGTLTAVVALPDDLAAQAIKLGHIRIGWVSCRIRSRVERLRCFRCWSPGHVAARGRGPDRTGLCYRCAKEGHQAKDCKARPTCVFCQGQGPDDHTSAGPSCPRAVETLQAPWSTEWGSERTTRRGMALLDALAPLEVALLNTGDTPTFVGEQGRSIIDLTFASDELVPRVATWQVGGLDTTSDHETIVTEIEGHRATGTGAAAELQVERSLAKQGGLRQLDGWSDGGSGGPGEDGGRTRDRHCRRLRRRDDQDERAPSARAGVLVDGGDRRSQTCVPPSPKTRPESKRQTKLGRPPC